MCTQGAGARPSQHGVILETLREGSGHWGCTPAPTRAGGGGRARVGAAREGFLGESLSQLRLRGAWEWGGGEDKVLGGRTGLCKGLGVVGRVQLRSTDTRSWAAMSSLSGGETQAQRGVGGTPEDSNMSGTH